MLVFKVGGSAQLPEKVSYTPPELNPPPSAASADVIADGAELYAANCSVCHGNEGVQQRSSFPNLTLSPLLYSQEGFDQVVLSGARVQRGMASFSDKLAAADSVAVREYIIARANEVKNAPPAIGGGAGAAPPAPARQAGSDDVHEEAADD
jgi:quinohemoprotein ethanol dehydrogenase